MGRNRSLLFIALLAAFLITQEIRSGELPEVVSMLQLISTPEKYDNKVLMVVGFLVIRHEGNILYLHKEDYEHGINKNGLWVVLEPANKKEFTQLNNHYVQLLGTFRASNKGHMSLESGAIENIKSAIPWPPDTPPRSN